MPNKYGVCVGIIVCLLLAAGCTDNQQEFQNEIQGAGQVGELSATMTDSSAPVRTATSIPPKASETAAAIVETVREEALEVEWIPSEEAGNFLGQVLVVRVEVSHCTYKQNVNGSPTFCNDQVYPNHTFTYLMWGVDLSRFDLQCVLVTGEIVEYDGKAQIVLEREEQITPCDG